MWFHSNSDFNQNDLKSQLSIYRRKPYISSETEWNRSIMPEWKREWWIFFAWFYRICKCEGREKWIESIWQRNSKEKMRDDMVYTLSSHCCCCCISVCLSVCLYLCVCARKQKKSKHFFKIFDPHNAVCALRVPLLMSLSSLISLEYSNPIFIRFSLYLF